MDAVQRLNVGGVKEYFLFFDHKIQSVPHGNMRIKTLISDAHEWINEIPTVPIYYLAKPQPRERAWQKQRGKKTLLSLTLVRHCEMTLRV